MSKTLFNKFLCYFLNHSCCHKILSWLFYEMTQNPSLMTKEENFSACLMSAGFKMRTGREVERP